MNSSLAVTGLKKAFGGVPVLTDVTFDAKPGSVTVLAGENGAGKSTLFKIVSGQISSDGGTVRINGEQLHSVSPHIARRLGVAVIPQELSPYEDLTVAENLFVGREPRRFGFVLRRRAMLNEARRLLLDFGTDIDPSRPIRSFSVAVRQIVEIVKATTSGASVLLMDEPTSSIPAAEVERLYDVIRRLKARGVAMVYTTHRMAEIQAVADRVVVLRDGYLVLNKRKEDTDDNSIVSAMIGRQLGGLFPALSRPGAEVALEINGLVRKKGAPQIDLKVRRGEIVGIGGIVGAGRSALLSAIYGQKRAFKGTVRIGSDAVVRPRISDSISAGLAFVPEDRKGDGLVLSQSVNNNLTLPHLRDYSILGFLNESYRKKSAHQLSERVQLQLRSIKQLAETLSGGNQQKIVIARWLDRAPSVLLLDEPTRGVDVGARGEIYRIIAELAESGMAVVLVSSDMPELISMSHRVCVMRGGKLVGELGPDELADKNAQELIFHYATGEKTSHFTAITD